MFLLLVLGLALLLRVWGLSWGLPTRTDLHPDETDYVLKHALLISDNVTAVVSGQAPFQRSTLDPVFLNYPSFLMYLIAAPTVVWRSLGGSTDPWISFLIGRWISALAGGLTILAVFALARRLGAAWPGALLAALWAALLPLHVWESHVAVTDVLMTLWCTVTLWASVRLVNEGRGRDYALAGLALGLATGAKYTAALAVIAVVTGALLSRRSWRNVLGGLVLAAAVSLVCCFLVTPFSFLRFHDVLNAMRYEHEHTTSHHYGFSLPANGWQYHRYLYEAVAAFPFSFGVVLYLCVVAGCLWYLVRLDRRRAVLAVFALAFFGLLGSWTFVPLRYYLPLLVPGVVVAALWQEAWLAAGRWRRGLAWVSIGATLLYTGVFTVQTTARYAHETRVEAERWLDARMEPGAQLLLCGWHRYLALPSHADISVVRERHEDLVGHLRPDRDYGLIEITSLLYERHYRQGNGAYIEAYDRLRDPAGPFQLVRRFESHFLNKDFYMRLDPMFEGYFLSPTLEFYVPRR